MIGYIYITTNIKTNLIYIGKHEAKCFEPNKYIGSGKILKTLIQEFGKQNFKCELLDTAETLDELWKKEQYWISYYNSTNPLIGYNILTGGSGCSGYNFTNEVKQKMSKACTINNLKRDKNVYNNVSKHHYGSKMMTNGVEQKWVYAHNIQLMLDAGWQFGSCKKRNRIYATDTVWHNIHKNDNRSGRIWIHLNDKKKWIMPTQLDEYITLGWKIGMKS